jgi:hypothetical protein
MSVFHISPKLICLITTNPNPFPTQHSLKTNQRPSMFCPWEEKNFFSPPYSFRITSHSIPSHAIPCKPTIHWFIHSFIHSIEINEMKMKMKINESHSIPYHPIPSHSIPSRVIQLQSCHPVITRTIELKINPPPLAYELISPKELYWTTCLGKRL